MQAQQGGRPANVAGWWIRVFQICVFGGCAFIFIVMALQSFLYWAGEQINLGAFTKRNADATFYYFLDMFFHSAAYVGIACFCMALALYGWDYLRDERHRKLFNDQAHQE